MKLEMSKGIEPGKNADIYYIYYIIYIIYLLYPIKIGTIRKIDSTKWVCPKMQEKPTACFPHFQIA
jgi:hypothetical protein